MVKAATKKAAAPKPAAATGGPAQAKLASKPVTPRYVAFAEYIEKETGYKVSDPMTCQLSLALYSKFQVSDDNKAYQATLAEQREGKQAAREEARATREAAKKEREELAASKKAERETAKAAKKAAPAKAAAAKPATPAKKAVPAKKAAAKKATAAF